MLECNPSTTQCCGAVITKINDPRNFSPLPLSIYLSISLSLYLSISLSLYIFRHSLYFSPSCSLLEPITLCFSSSQSQSSRVNRPNQEMLVPDWLKKIFDFTYFRLIIRIKYVLNTDTIYADNKRNQFNVTTYPIEAHYYIMLFHNVSFVIYMGGSGTKGNQIIEPSETWDKDGITADLTDNQEPTDTSKQPIRTRYLGHVTSYQPIRDQYFLIRRKGNFST
eukprot:sb/3469748/